MEPVPALRPFVLRTGQVRAESFPLLVLKSHYSHFLMGVPPWHRTRLQVMPFPGLLFQSRNGFVLLCRVLIDSCAFSLYDDGLLALYSSSSSNQKLILVLCAPLVYDPSPNPWRTIGVFRGRELLNDIS